MGLMTVGGGIADILLLDDGGRGGNEAFTFHAAPGGAPATLYDVVTDVSGTETFEAGLSETTSVGRIEAHVIDYGATTNPGGAWAYFHRPRQSFWLSAHSGMTAAATGDVEIPGKVVLGGLWLRGSIAGGLEQSLDLGVTWTPLITAGDGDGDGDNAPYVALWDGASWTTQDGTVLSERPAAAAGRVVLAIAYTAVAAPSWLIASHDIALIAE